MTTRSYASPDAFKQAVEQRGGAQPKHRQQTSPLGEQRSLSAHDATTEAG